MIDLSLDRLSAEADALCVEAANTRGRRFRHLGNDDLTALLQDTVRRQVAGASAGCAALMEEIMGELCIQGHPAVPPDVEQDFGALMKTQTFDQERAHRVQGVLLRRLIGRTQ